MEVLSRLLYPVVRTVLDSAEVKALKSMRQNKIILEEEIQKSSGHISELQGFYILKGHLENMKESSLD